MATENCYIGIDLGGTKVASALVCHGGRILARCKRPTPPSGTKKHGKAVLDTILENIAELTAFAEQSQSLRVRGIGLAVPGPVDYAANTVPLMPNLDIGGTNLAGSVAKQTSLPVTLVNDVDAITVGEGWFGPAGQGAHTLVDIAVGTGIGGGIMIDGKLYSGSSGSCAEIGHMRIESDGPTCGCGNRGCLETFASRTAIERTLRSELDAGRAKTLKNLLKDDDDRIKSGILAKALKAGDKQVEKTLTEASEALGRACITLKHLLAPDVIVLGGGVMDACGHVMLPVVQGVVAESSFMSAHKMEIIVSAMGDDAGITGAAAMAMSASGMTLKQIQSMNNPVAPKGVSVAEEGFLVDDELFFAGDMTVNVHGEALPRRKDALDCLDSPARLKMRDITRACKGGPQLLIIGSDAADRDPLRPKVREYLDSRAIQCQMLSGDDAIRAYNASPIRRALMLLTG